jgi:tRNA pseudouridine55 synthase
VSILVIDKASGPSSFAVVKRVRALLGGRTRVGHGGTLDPFASGVLPVCIGEGTKVLQYLLGADKTYLASIRLGVETDTLDRTGQVTCTKAVPALSAADLEAALAGFRGPIAQVPPMFSALKRDGRPLYAYARAGQELPREARTVVIHELALLAYAPPDRLDVRVRCSKGTYIRSLAADLGTRIGSGAHLQELRRIASGPFRIEQAITLDALAERKAEGAAWPTLSPLDALAHLPRVTVDEAQALALSRGQRLTWDALLQGADATGPVCAVRERGGGAELVAMIARDGDGFAKILRGFHGQPGAVDQRSKANHSPA